MKREWLRAAEETMDCRKGCGACCIAASITSPLPGMPQGKAAGEPCVNLNSLTFTCGVWGTSAYPDVCKRFQASIENCGETKNQALSIITTLELATQ